MKQAHADSLKSSVQAAYDAIAPQFSRTRQRPWGEFEAFLAYVRPGDRVLDLGCGNGRLFGFLRARLESFGYLGVDQSSQLLSLARAEHPEAEFLEQDMEHLDVPRASFNAVFCVAAFHHLPSPASRQAALERIHAALQPGGLLILTVWNLFQLKYFPSLLRAMGSFVLHLGRKLAWNDLWIAWGGLPLPRYYHAFTPRELQSLFRAGQWQIEELYFTRKGQRVGFWRSFNLVLVASKK